ncbi:MAG TPA: cobalamin-dependent protein [Nocardioides sp.]|nr:cobalamin-dependent protein [Nocardioides sp.]
MRDVYDRYFAAVSVADAARAVEVVDDALFRGAPPADLITDVLVRAQSTVGEKWQRGEWTVADEHAATAVAKRALTVVSPPGPASDGARHVVVACAEGEWHSLPARMAGELLRGQGLQVTMLGASTPADQLRRQLRSSDPDVLALSATMTTSLIGAADGIAAARAEGVPVVVGGNAWGEGQRRARALGAHLRLVDIRDVRHRLDELRGTTAPPLPVLPDEARWLAVVPQDVVTAAVGARNRADHPRAVTDRAARAEAERELACIGRHAAAAVACDDPSVLADHLDWLSTVREAHGRPATPTLASALRLAEAVEEQAPRGAAVLRAEVEAARRRHHLPRRTTASGASA